MPPVENSHTHSVEPVSADPGLDGMDIDDLSSFFEKTASGLVESALAGLDADQLQPPPVQNGEHTTTETVNGTSAPEEVTKTNGFITDYKELEALVAESTNNYVKTTLQGLSPTPYQPTVPTSTSKCLFMHQLDPQRTNEDQRRAWPPNHTIPITTSSILRKTPTTPFHRPHRNKNTYPRPQHLVRLCRPTKAAPVPCYMRKPGKLPCLGRLPTRGEKACTPQDVPGLKRKRKP